jgi:RecJ-like exonuclease
MTDRELLELIATQVGNITTDIEVIKKELNDFREESNDRFDSIEDKLDDMEANNADRHVTIKGEIKNIKATLSKVEIITADNWSDIARMKSHIKNKVK